jgi:hypothetical protein
MAKIKISELSVGDWVKVDDFDKVLIKRVSAIDGTRNQIGIIKNNRCGIYWYYEDEIVPIPLTPEILEKNGYEDCLCYFECEELYPHSFATIYYEDGVYYFGDEVGFIKTLEIKYVHQLQHALRLAGVEKEIVLSQS